MGPEGRAQMLGCRLPSGAMGVESEADLKAFPKLLTGSSAKGPEPYWLVGLKNNPWPNNGWKISYSVPWMTFKRLGLKIKAPSSLVVWSMVCILQAAPSRRWLGREPPGSETLVHHQPIVLAWSMKAASELQTHPMGKSKTPTGKEELHTNLDQKVIDMDPGENPSKPG